jgi:hypothetical protein
MVLKRSDDFSVQPLKPFAQGLEILAGIAHAQLVAGAMLTAKPRLPPQRSVAAPTPHRPGDGRRK